jgi:hypothetical protein
MKMQPFVSTMAWEKHTYPALFETAGNFYKTLEGIKNDPLLAPMLETTGLIPHDYQRDLISFTGEKNTDISYSYTLYYNGKSFAYINSCEELSEEFINMLIDGMRVMG